jgi:hypothetical protein
MLPNERYERQLRLWWARINAEVFGGLLVPPRLLIDRAQTENAVWDTQRSTLRFSHRFVRANSWCAVLEALKREMVHQYVLDVVGARDERAHQEVHLMLCDRLGVSAAPVDHDREAGSATVEDIKALFARGDSTADRAALSLAMGLARVPNLPAEEVSTTFSAHAVGPVGVTVEEHEHRVAMILVRLFGVACTWVDTLDPAGHPGQQLEVIGRDQDVRAAESIRALLLEEAGRRWTTRGSGCRGSWLNFLDSVVEAFERALPEGDPADGSAQARKVELMEFCKRRHGNFGSAGLWKP